MATLNAATAALEKYCGFTAARTGTVARRLLEEKLLEPGAPRVSVEISEYDFALLLLALASGSSLSKVAGRTVELCECLPHGIDLDVIPEAIRPQKVTALDILGGQIWNAARKATAVVSDLEVVETWPEVVLHLPEGVSRFVSAGMMAGHWQSSKQRRATRIPGAAIALAAQNLFAGEK